jgi:EmrB/QacA subfamily drug resistance transporter
MTGFAVKTDEGAERAFVDSFRDGPRGRRGWTLFIACAGVAMVIASMVALNTALSDIATATAATQTQLTWIVDSYTLLLACLLLPAGAIGDRYGRRSALLVGTAIFALASAAPLVFDSPLQIIAARGLAGAGAAFVMPATLSLLTVAYPPEARAKAVGIWAGVAGTAGLFGLVGTGLLIEFFDWRAIFWTLAIGGLLIFVLTLTIAESRDVDAPRLDVPGAVTIGAAVAVFVFGMLQAPAHGWSDPRVFCCLIAGAVLAVVFGLIELRRPQPLLDIKLFGNPNFGTGAAAITVVFLATFSLFFLVVQYLQQVKGYSALAAAVALSPMALPLLTLTTLSSWYVPKLGLRVVVFASMALVSIGYLCMCTLDVDSSYLEVCWPLMVISAGFGLCTAPTTSAIMSAAPNQKQGVASAVNDAAREVGGALGIALAGSILAGSYSHHIASALGDYPEPVRGPAADSLSKALAVANQLGPQGLQLAERSKEAFVAATHSSYAVIAIIVGVLALIIPLFAPGRDGEQLSAIRRLRNRGHTNRIS